MQSLDVTCSHSRPRVSNDNAFSESQFKTQKYQPDYPGRFDGSIARPTRGAGANPTSIGTTSNITMPDRRASRRNRCLRAAIER